MVTALLESTEAYSHGRTNGVRSIVSLVERLVSIYPAHIAKEDKEFFYPVLRI